MDRVGDGTIPMFSQYRISYLIVRVIIIKKKQTLAAVFSCIVTYRCINHAETEMAKIPPCYINYFNFFGFMPYIVCNLRDCKRETYSFLYISETCDRYTHVILQQCNRHIKYVTEYIKCIFSPGKDLKCIFNLISRNKKKSGFCEHKIFHFAEFL